MFKSFVLTCNLVFMLIGAVCAQTTPTTKHTPDFSSSPFPIIYGKQADGFPPKIKFKGTIVDASPAGFYCGTLAVAGTLKIKLDEKVAGYKDEYLYAVILCFAVQKKENLINQKVQITAAKLDNYPYKFDVTVVNNIDSKGVPFYQIQGVTGASEVLKSLGINQKKNQQ